VRHCGSSLLALRCLHLPLTSSLNFKLRRAASCVLRPASSVVLCLNTAVALLPFVTDSRFAIHAAHGCLTHRLLARAQATCYFLVWIWLREYIHRPFVVHRHPPSPWLWLISSFVTMALAYFLVYAHGASDDQPTPHGRPGASTFLHHRGASVGAMLCN
jgi:hypothetical protein